MLIEFSVGNFLSIKDRQTLRLDASSISEHKDQLIDAGRYQLLRSAVIYGANASGKSNVLKAMAAMRQIVWTSAEQSSTAEIKVEPFLLSTETENAPSYFEVLFIIDTVRYRYGFEADKVAIRAEWLYVAKKRQEMPLFLRENDSIEVFKEFKEGKGLEEKTRDNALFLSVCDQFNGQLAKKILRWFVNFNTISGLSHQALRKFTFRMLAENRENQILINFLNQFNLGFTLIKIEKEILRGDGYSTSLELDQSKSFEDADNEGITVAKIMRQKFDVDGEPVNSVDFDLGRNESSGTNKMFDLLGPIFDTLEHGKALIVDELDAKLHPLMTQAIIRLFNDPALNHNNAQLIFATHDTNLLTDGGFRRDQIYFTEKDRYGATCLYSLVEYQEDNGDKVRKDRSFEKDYIQGRYGAIPFIGDLSKLVPAWHEK